MAIFSPSYTSFINPYKFRVYRNAAYTTTAAAYTALPFDAASFDTSSNVDIVTNKGRFTAPVAGFYHLDAKYSVQATSGYVIIKFYKNGSAVSEGQVLNISNAASQGVTHTDTLQLAATDYVEVYYYTDGAQTMDVGSPACHFSGFLISTS